MADRGMSQRTAQFEPRVEKQAEGGGGDRNLGVDFSRGRRIVRKVPKEKPAQGAVRKVARAGIEPSVTYGVTATGCATMELDTLRTESFKAQSWSQVRGPFTASRLTLERVGRQVVNATTWRTREDVDINVFELAPWIVRRLPLRAVQAWQRREVSEGTGLEHLANGGVFEPFINMAAAGAVSRNG
ncbi:unnamed protein product, partial [Prorocentrum cordatum]